MVTRTQRLSRFSWAALGVLALGSCGTIQGSAPSTAPPKRTAGPRASTSDSAPPPRPPASSAPAGKPAAPPEGEALPVVESGSLEPPGSTRGTIACGASRCIAGKQACNLQQVTECVASGATPDGGMLFCDDGSDCGPGLTCCQTGASAALFQVCTPRKGPNSDCALEVCEPDGAACPKGQYCEGRGCVSERHVTCAKARSVCAKNQYCEWQSGQARCVDDPRNPSSDEPGYAAWACTRPSDCSVGQQCCTSSGSGWHHTYCAVNCDLTNTTTVCSTVGDCQRSWQLIPTGLRHRFKLGCAPIDDEAPPWLKGCKLDEPE